MRLRVLLEPHHGASYDQILALARATEDSGFDAFFRSDHYQGIDPDDTGYRPTDSWTTLAGLAVQTERIRLGTLMTASTYRRPGPLAVTVATVDAMSGGRAELGIGAAVRRHGPRPRSGSSAAKSSRTPPRFSTERIGPHARPPPIAPAGVTVLWHTNP